MLLQEATQQAGQRLPVARSLVWEALQQLRDLQHPEAHNLQSRQR